MPDENPRTTVDAPALRRLADQVGAPFGNTDRVIERAFDAIEDLSARLLGALKAQGHSEQYVRTAFESLGLLSVLEHITKAKSEQKQ